MLVKSFVSKGFKCEIKLIKFSIFSHYCGYVYIRKSDILAKFAMDSVENCSFHGGVTYSEYLRKNIKIGYDCGHYGDSIEVQDLAYNIGTLKTITSELCKLRENLKEDLEVNPEKYV